MSLLERHLDQICLSSESIATLPFPPPKIFTNALLTQHDITSLIRDTEPHERALFSVPPPQPPTTAQTPYPDPKPSNRRQTVFNVASGEVTTGSGPSARGPRRNTAVAAVLGPELHSQVRKSEGPQGKGDVNVEVLLRGAEKLNNVYSIPGVPDRIHSLRTRHGQLQNSLAHYETKVARQTRELQRMNKGDSWDGSGEEDEDREAVAGEETELEVTDEDLRREEEEIAELERKKKELEDRLYCHVAIPPYCYNAILSCCYTAICYYISIFLLVAMIQNNSLFQGVNLQMVSNIHIILTALEALRSGGPLPLLTPSIASAIGTIRANMANNPLLGEIIDAVLALPRATVDDALVAGRIIHDFLMDMTLRPGTPDYGAAVAALRIFQPVPRPGLLSGPEDLVILSRSVPVRHHEHERGPSTLGLTSSRERGSGRGATQPSREREPENQGNIVSLGERYVAQRRSGIGRGNDLRPSGQGRLASNFSTAEELARNQQTVERLQLENENENENDENEDERFILESRRDIAGISRGTDSPTPAAEDEDEDDLEEKAEEGTLPLVLAPAPRSSACARFPSYVVIPSQATTRAKGGSSFDSLPSPISHLPSYNKHTSIIYSLTWAISAVSPTITQVSSRSPTPSPPDNHVVPPRLHRYQSRSPHRPPSSYKEKIGEIERSRRTREASPAPAPRRSDVSQPSAVNRNASAAEATSSPSKVPQLPLLQDVSQYINTQLSAVATASATTTLEELAHLVRLSTYQERKRSHSRIRLQRSLVSTALSARLARCGELSHRTLVDNFRADEKKSFANLYNAIHDVQSSCDATRRYALLEPDLDGGRPAAHGEDAGSLSTFMHEIPQRARETLLTFLTQIRTNPDYLASRVSNLTAAELSALTGFHQGLEPIDSVLPFHSRSKGHNPSAHRNFSHIPSAVERLLSFQRHDPLSALVHTCFANSAGPDSGEDLRRTDVWATTCARLITESKSGTDPFICSVLNVWTAMRDWSGRSNMEWYLMKILEDGAFLLEKAEDQAGTRIHVEPRNAKDSIAADEFYEAAILGLFEVVDDPGAGGIPEGLVELGNAILRKLDPKRHGPTRRFLVSKWLFSVFLLNAIIHPESYGMMSEYHITEYGRQKILKEVAMRAQRLVVDMTWYGNGAIHSDKSTDKLLRNKTSSTPLAIKSHIENILARFRSTRPSRSNAKLLPARSITSLRETVEVHPYLVLSPSDLVTMVNALFPERRPTSSVAKDIHFTGLRSPASSISGISAMSPSIMSGPRGAFDNASIVSNSGSSVISDITTSREPLLDEHSTAAHRFSPSSMTSLRQKDQRLSYYEDDGYELRIALHEMSQALGLDGTSGACHPCAERWAVLFMSYDGQILSTQMIHDPDDEADDEETTSSSDSEDEAPGSRPDLDKDYHQLRDSILKLVEDYEIPQSLNSKSESKTFSNRTSTLESPRRKHRSRLSSSAQVQSKNPYRPRDLSPSPKKSTRQIERQRSGSESTRQIDEEPSVLISMLEAAESQCQAQSDFVNAHLYWKTLNQLHQLSSESLKRDGFASLLNIFSRGPRDSIRRSASAIEEYDAWLVWLKQSQERHDVTIDSMMKRLKALRDKMWYVTDVRNSAAYEGARNIAVALKCMASPKKNSWLPPAGVRPRNASKSSTNNFLLKTEAQVMDMMAAREDQGGPNKLSDEQSEKTLRWLSQFGVENFCKGEERIHRFCLEIEACINKLVGDNLMDGPVLWSSELFYRDKRLLDSGRQKGDLYLNGFASLNISGDDSTESDAGRRGLRSTDFSRQSSRDLRAMSTRNNSQQSFDSSRYSMPRLATTGDLMDAQDYFGMASPVLTIDSATTFWSPFQTRAQSPSTSLGSIRPGTASSTNETVTVKDERANMSKQRFLLDLKQTLTSLLVSDLGTLVFARGSETDSWFSGDLGQDCMERKERADRKARRKQKKRVIEKKKSFRDLRSAQKTTDLPSERVDSHSERSEKGMSSILRTSLDHGPHDTYSVNDSPSTSDATVGGSRKGIMRDMESPEFPYRKAFQRLLRMFSVHPNPYTKLNALYELEHLIIAYLTPSAPRRPRLRQDALTATPQSPELQHINAFGPTEATVTPRAKNLEEAIDNCKERRSHIINQPETSSGIHRTTNERTAIPTPASTDMIVDVLQDLFRDADVRPKTLFRDLQFIASFIPAAILDKTERGKAFWDTGLAALGLKQDVCRTLIEIADEVVVHYTQTRKPTNLSPEALPPTNSHGELMKYSMQDAAKMWTITAKEGDPVAERELATFYLTHPELVERVTAPLSKPRETFKAQVMEMHQGREGVVNERDRERSDPATMCVAYHWMELSALGGDELARKYLRQREELNAIP
ncbi:hypothetical protein B7494_g4917 [Chlorociboria aeruginascens]|nr:hypothetical protein B7494_g4917 [Chlorociboria aeruginascens]